MSRRIKRETSDYVAAANRLYKIIPSLKKYIKRKRLTRWEKGAIARKEKGMQWADQLIPLTPAQAKKLKDHLYVPRVETRYQDEHGAYHVDVKEYPPVNALQLKNTGKDVAIDFVRDDLFITTNGRVWLYWSLERFRTSDMAKAGQKIFKNVAEVFPIEQIAQLAQRAFKRPKTKEVYLWTDRGRVGDGFMDLESFMGWLYESYGGYTDPDKWVKGLAIRL